MRDRYKEQLTNHLEQREWGVDEINRMVRYIGQTCMSNQSALHLLEYQQMVDERIENEKKHDEVFYQPTLFEVKCEQA